MAEEQKETLEIFKTKEGDEVIIKHNGTHWVAFDENHKQVGLPWVKQESLKDELGIAYEGSEPVKKVQQPEIETPEPTEVRLNGTLIDGTEVKCEIGRAHV